MQQSSLNVVASLACPSCHAYRLFLTRERIVICQDCLNGYRQLSDGTFDMRLDQAISFKKHLEESSQTQKAGRLVVLMGLQRSQVIDVLPSHCVVLARNLGSFDADLTYIGKGQVLQARQSIDAKHQSLIEMYLAPHSNRQQINGTFQEFMTIDSPRFLGQYKRLPDFAVDDKQVSRTHAVVFCDGTTLKVLDLLSKNGTFVNGKEVEMAELHDNDVLSLGETSLRVQLICQPASDAVGVQS